LGLISTTVTSSKTSVATISSKTYTKKSGYRYVSFKVNAKKAGTTTVKAYAKYGKKSTSWKVTVKKVTALTTVAISNYSTGKDTAIAVGDILKATPAQSSATVKYQWYSVDASGTATAIAGATEQTYKVAGTDLVGKTVKVVITGTGSYTGTAEATTTAKVTATAVTAATITNVAGADLTAATATVAPVVGDVLTANTTPAKSDVTYQWYVGGTAVAAATTAT